MNNDDKILKKLKKIRETRKRRAIIGSFLLSVAIVMSEISIFIFIGIFDLNIYVGVLLLLISLIFLCCGLYLMSYTPPVIE
jgi:uncharacterized membrane protein